MTSVSENTPKTIDKRSMTLNTELRMIRKQQSIDQRYLERVAL